MKAGIRILVLSALTLVLGLGVARATSLNYTLTGTGTSSDNTGINIPTNCTINTTITISTTGSTYSGSAGAIVTFPHAPYVFYHVLGLTASYVTQSWTDYQTADTYRVQEFCGVSAPAVGTVSVTFTW